MPKRPRIVITGDILRASADGLPNQPVNIRWLYHVLRYPLTRALAEASIETVVWDGEACGFDGRRVYELSGLPVCEEAWARLATADALSPPVVAYLQPFFADAVVIGFELPDVLVRHFEDSQTDYVDFAIHPVRYLDDLLFGIRTNIPEAFDALRARAMDEEIFHLHAALHRATVSRMKPLEIPADSCLCVGQTRVDKSLIANGRILSLADYLEDIRRLASQHGRMLFKPHPYGSCEDDVRRLLAAVANAEVTHANIYRLLADDRISKVVGISSSVIYEAGFFGKQGTYLYRNPMKFYCAASPPDLDPWMFIPIGDDFLSPHFWVEMLGGRCAVNGASVIRLAPKTSRLRISLQNHWGYNFLDYEILLRNLQGERV